MRERWNSKGNNSFAEIAAAENGGKDQSGISTLILARINQDNWVFLRLLRG
jgi:hypothetical protein